MSDQTIADQLKYVGQLKQIEKMALNATEEAARHIYLLTAEFLRRETGCESCRSALLKIALRSEDDEPASRKDYF